MASRAADVGAFLLKERTGPKRWARRTNFAPHIHVARNRVGMMAELAVRRGLLHDGRYGVTCEHRTEPPRDADCTAQHNPRSRTVGGTTNAVKIALRTMPSPAKLPATSPSLKARAVAMP